MPSSSAAMTSRRAVDFLLAQAGNGFQEALEIQIGLMGVPVLIGSVFPVSLILLALRQADPERAREVIETESRAISDLGAEDGWRYFNLSPDIPPDADDLAQAIALLGPSARLAGPLARLLANEVAPGRFRTWLVADPAVAAEADERWAAGPAAVHPEVVANLLASLLALDPERFRESAVAGIDWLLIRADEGLWSSYWYYGAAYGTYQVLRLLDLAERCFGPHPTWSEAREQARAALLATRDPSGGWRVQRAPVGLVALGGPMPEPARPGVLETAYATAALRLADVELDALEPAFDFLVACQEADGGFPAEPFYFTLGLRPHQSRCLTTAAVLLATNGCPPLLHRRGN